jgi:hypothetical protein
VVDAFIASDEKDKVFETPNPEAREKESEDTVIPLRLVKYT